MADIVVVDTSVLISALIAAKGPSREILRRCLKHEYIPLISNTLFSEYEDVIGRKKILDLCPLEAQEIREIVNALYSVCLWVPVYFLWRPNLKDEGDNFLIELALAGNANIIISNNISDLRGSELKFPGLRILTPEQILRGG
ncbi:MAG: putative toxin-antitoxin system toxin component, PIN family [Chromatiaceae bacterium]|nr:putative toxin-antitoxin system toxin component, PIN family [Chromatiaceae bacterium]